MASVTPSSNAQSLQLLRGQGRAKALSNVGPPGLLRCLIVSWCGERMKLFRTAAERQAWQTIGCDNAKHFVEQVFREQVPLTIVDLPQVTAAEYDDIRQATDRAVGVSQSLFVVCGATSEPAVELWARQLGVWTYLPEAKGQDGLELVFGEARRALAKRASAYIESGGCWVTGH